MGVLLPFPTPRAIEPWLTKHQLATHYGLSLRTVQRWANHGCPHRRYGNRLRFRISDVECWLEERSA